MRDRAFSSSARRRVARRSRGHTQNTIVRNYSLHSHPYARIKTLAFCASPPDPPVTGVAATCAPLPPPRASRLGLARMSAQRGTCRSAARSLKLRPQCGQGTRSSSCSASIGCPVRPARRPARNRSESFFHFGTARASFREAGPRRAEAPVARGFERAALRTRRRSRRRRRRRFRRSAAAHALEPLEVRPGGALLRDVERPALRGEHRRARARVDLQRARVELAPARVARRERRRSHVRALGDARAPHVRGQLGGQVPDTIGNVRGTRGQRRARRAERRTFGAVSARRVPAERVFVFVFLRGSFRRTAARRRVASSRNRRRRLRRDRVGRFLSVRRRYQACSRRSGLRTQRRAKLAPGLTERVRRLPRSSFSPRVFGNRLFGKLGGRADFAIRRRRAADRRVLVESNDERSFVSRPVVRASLRVAAFESRRRGVVPARARPEPTRRAAILQGGQLGRRGPRRGANALRTLQGLHAEGSHRGRMRIIVVAVFVRCKTRRTPERERVLAAEIRSLAEFRVRRIARADFRRHPGQPRAARVVAAERVRLVRPRLLGDVELAVPPRPVVQRGPGPVGNASRRVEGVHLTPVAG